jgi:hypothetical protein
VPGNTGNNKQSISVPSGGNKYTAATSSTGKAANNSVPLLKTGQCHLSFGGDEE